MSVFNADYPGREQCEAHWAGVRAGLVKPTAAPSKSLAEQADAQIHRLNREMAEWRAIKAKA